MPLIKGKSQKAFEHNIKTEMEHGKPQNQALAIAYATKRKAKKKASGGTVESGSPDMNMADGGHVPHPGPSRSEHQKIYDAKRQAAEEARLNTPEGNAERMRQNKERMKKAEGGVISAHNEARPSTQEENNDKHSVARQVVAKALDPKQDATSPKNRTSALKGMKTTPIKHPKMVPSDTLSTRLYDKEGNLQESERPSSPDTQPDSSMDEEGANRQGPAHKRTDARHMASSTDVTEHHDEPSLKRTASPSMDEGASTARHDEEEGPNRQGPAEKSTQAKTGRKPTHGLDMLAEGGGIEKEDDPKGIDYIVPDTGFGKIIVMKADGGSIEHEMMEQPEEEAHEERANSIAAAIMAKKARETELHSDSDEDRMVKMAKGGILSMHATDTTEDEQADLDRNAQEDNNHEDQLSFDALRKENYSESDALSDLTQPTDSNETGDDREDARSDAHDMVESIRRKMKSRRQMPQE